jgi:GSH-dependent disulfide-bond oxidoreductase
VLEEKVDRSGAKPTGERWDNLFGAGQFATSEKTP